jgi:hypothetical protein
MRAAEPDGDPLGHYLRSLRMFISEMPDDGLILPGHMRPFYGLHARTQELIAHHEARCDIILDACCGADRSVAELVPLLFHRRLDPHQMGFAFRDARACPPPRAARRARHVVEGGAIPFSLRAAAILTKLKRDEIRMNRHRALPKPLPADAEC